MTSRLRTSEWVIRSSSSFSVPRSIHCRSSRNSTRDALGGRSAEERRNTDWNRVCASCGRELGHRRLLADDAFQLRDEVDHQPAVDPSASSKLAPAASSVSLLPSRSRTRLWNAWASVA